MGIREGYVFAFWAELIYVVLVLVMINRAQKGMKIPTIYKVSGLEALDEAIGRCTEMGKPVHYTTGYGKLDDAQTMAGLSILGEVAKKCANYDTELIETNAISAVYPIADAIVRQSYVEVGKADMLKPETVRFISEDQFAYATGVTGIMYRERPGANILIGRFFAESLLFAEIGANVGCMQIAGTASVNQIPFFVVACDYVLIGEEIYAASAYLTREPVLMGTLVAQDWGKLAVVAMIILGSILESSGNPIFSQLLTR